MIGEPDIRVDRELTARERENGVSAKMAEGRKAHNDRVVQATREPAG